MFKDFLKLIWRRNGSLVVLELWCLTLGLNLERKLFFILPIRWHVMHLMTFVLHLLFCLASCTLYCLIKSALLKKVVVYTLCCTYDRNDDWIHFLSLSSSAGFLHQYLELWFLMRLLFSTNVYSCCWHWFGIAAYKILVCINFIERTELL